MRLTPKGAALHSNTASFRSARAARFARSESSERVRAHRVWIGVFTSWILLLSGVAANVIGSPGALQLVRLRNLLASRQAQVQALSDELGAMQLESTLLEKSKIVQQREIRRVLGYAAPDEMIFDFTAAD